MSSNIDACIQWGYLSGCTPWGRKSTVGHEHEATSKVSLHVRIRWTIRITRGKKHESNVMGIGVFLHASGGVTYNIVVMLLLEVFMHTCEQLQA